MTSQWKVIISWSGRIRLLKYREHGDFTCGRHVITFSQTSQNYCTKRLWAGTDQTTWPAGTSAVTDSSPQSTTAGSGVPESSSLQCKGELTSVDYFCWSINSHQWTTFAEVYRDFLLLLLSSRTLFGTQTFATRAADFPPWYSTSVIWHLWRESMRNKYEKCFL